MNEQDGTQTASTPRSMQTQEEWKAYWQARGQAWRTEAEIDEQRQAELNTHLVITPDIEHGIYPFKGMKLGRADIEWLLASHQNGKGPVDINEEDQHERMGLDLRGADLHRVNLTYLPLTRMLGGLSLEEGINTSVQARQAAAIKLEECDLSWAHLEQAFLSKANLNKVVMLATHLEGADLGGASLKNAILASTHLEGCDLTAAQMERANLIDAHLEGTDLRGASMERTNLLAAHLAGAYMRWIHLEGANLNDAHLEGKALSASEQKRIQKWKKYFPSHLPPADLRQAFFNSTTNFENAHLGDEKNGFVSLADAHWDGANLTVINWQHISRLGDEERAHYTLKEAKKRGPDEQRIQDVHQHQLQVLLRSQEVNNTLVNYVTHSETLQQQIQERVRSSLRNSQLLGIVQPAKEYEQAVRAYNQLTALLQTQGLNSVASRFAYRAHILQRQVLLRQKPRKMGAYLFSLFLDLIAGYGHRPERSLAIYIVTLIGFALIYYLLGLQGGLNIPPLQALVISVVSFHGRGLFPVDVHLNNIITSLGALEAIIGIIIEISFIATFTSRFFGK